jgi:hypothetical protein
VIAMIGTPISAVPATSIGAIVTNRAMVRSASARTPADVH